MKAWTIAGGIAGLGIVTYVALPKVLNRLGLNPHYKGRRYNVDFTQYGLVYMAGGWGAAYDLGTSEVLGRKISEAYAAGAVLGSVCHGVLGFLQATDESGEPHHACAL